MAVAIAPEGQETSPDMARHGLSSRSEKLSDPKYQAYLLLRTVFITAPILFGVDKYFNWMTYGPKYLWVGFPNLLGVSPQHFMYGVGAIEIAAGLGGSPPASPRPLRRGRLARRHQHQPGHLEHSW